MVGVRQYGIVAIPTPEEHHSFAPASAWSSVFVCNGDLRPIVTAFGVSSQVMELDNIVAAMTGQSAQTQATCASLMVAHGFFFAAMKAVFVFPEVLRAVLEDIKLQVNQFVSTPRIVISNSLSSSC